MFPGKFGMIKEKTKTQGTILLTGATGFLGAHLLPALVSAGYQVVVFKRQHSDVSHIAEYSNKVVLYDIDGKRPLKGILSRHVFDGMIHLATDYGKRNNNDVSQMCQVNIDFATELLNWAAKNECKFFVNTHTYAHSEYTLYSAMKNAFLEILKYYANNFSLKIINMRLEYVYGPKDDTTKLIPAMIESFLHGKSIRSSPGKQKRDFVFVEDVVWAYLKVLSRMTRLPKGLTEFGIGTGTSITLKSFVHKIEKLMGVSRAVEWGAVSYRRNEIFDSKADTRLARRYLGWKSTQDDQQGLLKTIDWHKEQSL